MSNELLKELQGWAKGVLGMPVSSSCFYELASFLEKAKAEGVAEERRRTLAVVQKLVDARWMPQTS